MVTAIGFAVPHRSIDYWQERLAARNVTFRAGERFGDPVIRFTDPHGLPLELTGAEVSVRAAGRGEDPAGGDHAIAGFHSATATLTSLEETKALLDRMGLRLQDRENDRYRFGMDGPASPGGFYDIVVDPRAQAGRPGGGTVHHIAFRTRNEETQAAWRSALIASGLSVTGVRNRKYFRSIYFHAPERILFEIATDPPGFTVDETEDRLGTSLKLPDALEPMRAEIERRLPPLRLHPGSGARMDG